MAQLVICPTLDLSSGLDLRVVSSRPTLGSMLAVEPVEKKKKRKRRRRKTVEGMHEEMNV